MYLQSSNELGGVVPKLKKKIKKVVKKVGKAAAPITVTRAAFAVAKRTPTLARKAVKVAAPITVTRAAFAVAKRPATLAKAVAPVAVTRALMRSAKRRAPSAIAARARNLAAQVAAKQSTANIPAAVQAQPAAVISRDMESESVGTSTPEVQAEIEKAVIDQAAPKSNILKILLPVAGAFLLLKGGA